jgi:hypothetical protein
VWFPVISWRNGIGRSTGTCLTWVINAFAAYYAAAAAHLMHWEVIYVSASCGCDAAARVMHR